MIWIAAAAAIAGLYQLVAIAASLKHLFSPEPPSGPLPPVSILKPVRGRDPHFYEAIRSHALIDYPEFEILFGVREAGDPAVEDIQRLIAEFPQVPIRLVCGGYETANGKVGILMRLAEEARFPVLLVNDSDIRVPPDYLRRTAGPLMATGAGLVTCLYRATADSWAGRWEALGIATGFVPGVLVAPLAGVREFGLGSTLAFRAEDLTRIGGFAALAGYLADDYQLAKRITALGKPALMAKVVVEIFLGDAGWRGVWKHQVRWARTVRVSRGGGYAGLPVTHAGLWALVALAAGHPLIAAGLAALRVAGGLAAGWGVLRSPAALAAPLIPLWDLWAFAVYAAGLVGNTVEWRGDRLRLNRDGTITRLPQPGNRRSE